MTGWTTRETAEKCGLSQHTLRWYERIGLLDRVARTADATAMPTWTGSCC
ncbi:MAG: MerR family DNA-binding transcriptional regulator [Streptosporangiaceae bacterium]